MINPSFDSGFASSPHDSLHPGLWRGLIGAWIPSLGHTGTRLVDVSSGRNHGAFTGSLNGTNAWVLSGERKFSSYTIDFPGVDTARVDVPASPSIEGMNAITMACWVRREGTVPDNGSQLAAKSNGSSGRDYGLLVRNDNFARWAINNNELANTTTIATDTWFFLLGTWRDSDDVREFYVNNVLEANDTIAGPLQDNNAAFSFGGHPDTVTDRHYEGKIGPTLMWNRVVNVRERRLLFNDPLAMFRRQPIITGSVTAGPVSSLPYYYSIWRRRRVA